MEQHDVMKCPKCGGQMLPGQMLGGALKFSLFWFPENKKAKGRHLWKFGFPCFQLGDVQTGMQLHPYNYNRILYLPALNCPQCKLILLDYDEEHIETEQKFWD